MKKLIIIFKRLILGLALISIPTTMVYSQASFNTTRGLGMGGASTATVSGFSSNFVNPANLAIPQRTKWSITFISGLNPDIGGGLANFALYNEYYTTGLTITPELNLQIADKWFGSEREAYQQLGFNIDFTPLGISYQTKNMGFALAIRSRILGDVGISKGAFLASTGLNSDIYGDFRNFDIKNTVVGFAEVSAGIGMKVWETSEKNEPGTMRVYAGIAPKFLLPLHYHSVSLKSRLRVQENPYLITHEFSYEINTVGQFGEDLHRFAQDRVTTGEVPKTDDYFDNSFSDVGQMRGGGFGLDLGATFEFYMPDFLPDFWAFRGAHRVRGSVALTDLGSISLTDSPTRVFNTNTFIWDGLDVDQNRLEEDFDSSFGDYFDSVITDSIGRDIYLNFNSVQSSKRSVGLPTNFNFGAAYDAGKFTVAFDIGKGFNELGTNSERTYFALGAEFRPVSFIPIRVGTRTGGFTSRANTFGTGVNLKNFEFTFAAMVVPNSEAYGTSVAFAFSGLVVRF